MMGDTEAASSLQRCDPRVIAGYVQFCHSASAADANKPGKKRKKPRTKDIPPAVLETRRKIQLCCRDNDLPLAITTFHSALQNNVKLEAQTFYILLNLCDGTFAERTGVHVGTPRAHTNPGGRDDDKTKSSRTIEKTDSQKTKVSPAQISAECRQGHAHQIHELMSALNIALTEQAYTALVRLASRVGDYDSAERYLDEAERTQQCKVKLRMYSSLLRAYCGELSDGDGVTDTSRQRSHSQEGLSKALKVWKRMYDHSGGPSSGHPDYRAIKTAEEKAHASATEQPNQLFGEGIAPKITLSECEYSAIMSCATSLRDAPVMERILSDLAEEVLVPGSKTTQMIIDWFAKDTTGSSGISSLDQVTLPPRHSASIGAVINDNCQGWTIHRRCGIESLSGELKLPAKISTEATKFCLKPVELVEREWDALRAMNSAIVLEGQVEGNVSKFQGGRKGKKRPRTGEGGGNKSQWRVDAWQRFETFIERHPPYGAVVDGANVGYFDKNFHGSPKHVDYRQIDWLLRHMLEQEPHRHVIMFLHERHFSSKLAPGWAFPIIDAWDSDRAPYSHLTVYRTPAGMNDDWYWMHAALINGGKADKQVLAVTNDEMRDHHFQMLAHGSFLRWKERHQIHFDFGPYRKQLGRQEVILDYPSLYSRRIQRIMSDDGEGDAIVIPLPKKGDCNRFADGLHIAEDGVPEEETYTIIERVK
ncbi:hypothetical protein THAOC_16122 [Thalassiosira oceanica]|uniref:Mitochondrial ribonuclease P catalytic subunit n=1 Tax=Thalassiosira oceanica TaxID=159749 RepID=K0SD21_THAOC|nr:hypothetical protein THAOC_16122 [Thalassiosira oceanica]|mmetsp:Transcript_38841/g.87542  ORF Transcript_38841/g.87542 Transcript_38841/m.87542 type:complete len:704 (-) Transcript_38841:1146-3257(-)|eukprot:EJK63235.1 hypothetical protein THAOC_16122 [Thalassiosira oceanica]